jgi:hypothetical protein
VELLIVPSPDRDSRLPYVLRLPLGERFLFRTSGAWPRSWPNVRIVFATRKLAEEWTYR